MTDKFTRVSRTLTAKQRGRSWRVSVWYNTTGCAQFSLGSEVRFQMIVDQRIAGTRITVWDVLHHLENDWPLEEIAEVLRLSDEQVQAAVEYIHTRRAEVMKVHEQIEERNARGNSPNIQAKLDAARTRRLEWVDQRQKTTTR